MVFASVAAAVLAGRSGFGICLVRFGQSLRLSVFSFFLSLCCLHSGRLSVAGFTEQRNGERVPGCISGCRSCSQQLCCIQAFRQYSLTGLVSISSPVAQDLLHHPSFFPTSVLHMCGTSQTTIRQQDCG